MRNPHSGNHAASVILLAAFSLGAPALTAAQTPTFLPARSYPVGGQPLAFAVGDFNNDGIPDLLSVILNGSSTIALGDGTGGFRTPTAINGSAGLCRPAVADFNRDGKLDVILGPCGNLGTTAELFLGNGDGGVQPAIAVPLGVTDEYLTSADFNADGIPDLAAAGGTGQPRSQIAVLLGRGDGTFATPVIFSQGEGAYYLAAGDFNGDGRADLASLNDLDGVSIYLSNGDGTFRFVSDYALDNEQQALATGDMNGDGKLDLLSVGGRGIWFFSGNGDGTFTVGPDQGQVQYSRAIAADLNGDGRIDFAGTTSQSTGAEYDLLIGDGTGKLQPANTIPTQTTLDPIIAADLNGDGLADLVLADDSGGQAVVLINSTTQGDSIWTDVASNTRAGTDSLTKLSGCDGCFDGGAVSKAVFETGDASVQFAAGALDPLRIVGFASNFTPYDPSTMDFALRMQAGDVEVLERGMYRTDVRFTVADQLGIAVHDGVVTYSKNSVVFYTSTVAPTYPFAVAVTLANVGSSITSAIVAGGSSSGGGGGGWSNTSHVDTTATSAQKTSGCDGCFDAWAVFADTLTSGDGFVEFTIADPAPLLEAGLAHAFVPGDEASLDFAFKIQGGWAEVREQGVYQTDLHFSAGDVFRISVDAGVVSFSHNGAVFHTSARPPDLPLSFSVLFAALGGSVSNVTVSGGS